MADAQEAIPTNPQLLAIGANRVHDTAATLSEVAAVARLVLKNGDLQPDTRSNETDTALTDLRAAFAAIGGISRVVIAEIDMRLGPTAFLLPPKHLSGPQASTKLAETPPNEPVVFARLSDSTSHLTTETAYTTLHLIHDSAEVTVPALNTGILIAITGDSTIAIGGKEMEVKTGSVRQAVANVILNYPGYELSAADFRRLGLEDDDTDRVIEISVDAIAEQLNTLAGVEVVTKIDGTEGARYQICPHLAVTDERRGVKKNLKRQTHPPK